MRYLLSLMLVGTMTCELVHNDRKFSVYRCENNEVVCYMTHTYYTDSISCKFKEQEQWLRILQRFL
jgi:hypothetical protein